MLVVANAAATAAALRAAPRLGLPARPRRHPRHQSPARRKVDPHEHRHAPPAPLGGRLGTAASAHGPARPRGSGRRWSALLLATAVLYLWELGRAGWANSYYAAAVQAGTQSWKAFFFGSLDASNFITVDKPPASLWVMGLSGAGLRRSTRGACWCPRRSPASLRSAALPDRAPLVRRRPAGAARRRRAGADAGGGADVPLQQPRRAPDAAARRPARTPWCGRVEAGAHAGGSWSAGALVGLAFLAKMLQAFLVVPAFALVYLLAAPGAAGPPRLGSWLGAGARSSPAAGGSRSSS